MASVGGSVDCDVAGRVILPDATSSWFSLLFEHPIPDLEEVSVCIRVSIC